ncbi:hypothetical protein NQ317_013379 [Molorchus minor]|uniref:Uncharacterized protein n=1 Tax=Molorchus minor TaxID=1323400 RepID=A0ABQ9ITQ3_9CUCU|nr:hypothetical protein NQ317_013379 [Molorchus minor]
MDINGRPIKWIPRKRSSLSDNCYLIQYQDSNIRRILESGLLLDEDLEVLLGVSESNSYQKTNNYRPSLFIFSSMLSIIGVSVLVKKYHIPVLIVPSVIFAVTSAAFELLRFRKIKNKKEIVGKLIEAISRTHKMNHNIKRYIKIRTELGNNSFWLENRKLKEFFDFLLQNEYELLKILTSVLERITVFNRELLDDFKCLLLLNPLENIQTNGQNIVDDWLLIIQRVQDIHVLFTSKFLSYIGIACSSNCSFEDDLNLLLDKTLPDIVKYLHIHNYLIKKQFMILRQPILKNSEYSLQSRRKPWNKRIVPKLRDTLICSVNNLSVIFEKSQNILDALENADDIEVNQFSDAIIDLRNHTFATYESLDLLCKLQGIVANSNSSNPARNKPPSLLRTDNLEKSCRQ